MWRPGKLRFLIGVKNPLPIDRPRPPENTAPCGAPPVARFATPVGLRPPFVTHPATLPHPDRRALLILFAAQHALVILPAHQGKDAGRKVRGHSGFMGNADVVLHVEADKAVGAIKVTVEKMRDGRDGSSWVW